MLNSDPGLSLLVVLVVAEAHKLLRRLHGLAETTSKKTKAAIALASNPKRTRRLFQVALLKEGLPRDARRRGRSVKGLSVGTTARCRRAS